jgi:hypothetical protein
MQVSTCWTWRNAYSITQGTLNIHEPIIAQLQTVPSIEVTLALSLSIAHYQARSDIIDDFQ